MQVKAGLWLCGPCKGWHQSLWRMPFVQDAQLPLNPTGLRCWTHPRVRGISTFSWMPLGHPQGGAPMQLLVHDLSGSSKDTA